MGRIRWHLRRDGPVRYYGYWILFQVVALVALMTWMDATDAWSEWLSWLAFLFFAGLILLSAVSAGLAMRDDLREERRLRRERNGP